MYYFLHIAIVDRYYAAIVDFTTDLPWDVRDFTSAVMGIRLDRIIVCLERFELVFTEMFGMALKTQKQSAATPSNA